MLGPNLEIDTLPEEVPFFFFLIFLLRFLAPHHKKKASWFLPPACSFSHKESPYDSWESEIFIMH